jgi:hypothetical protein
MDSGTLGMVGTCVGAIVSIAGGYAVARSAYEAAGSEALRLFLRRIYLCGGIWAAAVMIGVILLAAFRLVPQSLYLLAFVLWFGPLVPVLLWMRHRLDELAPRRPMTAQLDAAPDDELAI